MKHKNLLAVVGLALTVFVSAGTLEAQHDPGPRAGTPGAGGSFPGLSPDEQSFFNQAIQVFMEVDSVSGSISGESGSGLGPTFNGNSCAQCHAHPSVGGSSPTPNPQVGLATVDGGTNTVPSFITANGPVREARFIKNSDGSLDGGVHGLYTIMGRSDAEGCSIAQPNFAQQLAAHNVIFRIPTPDLRSRPGGSYSGFDSTGEPGEPIAGSNLNSALAAASIPAAMMGPSPALAGKPRTSR